MLITYSNGQWRALVAVATPRWFERESGKSFRQILLGSNVVF